MPMLCRECGKPGVRALNFWFCSQACAKARANRALESASDDEFDEIVRTGKHVVEIEEGA